MEAGQAERLRALEPAEERHRDFVPERAVVGAGRVHFADCRRKRHVPDDGVRTLQALMGSQRLMKFSGGEGDAQIRPSNPRLPVGWRLSDLNAFRAELARSIERKRNCYHDPFKVGRFKVFELSEFQC